MENLLTVIEIGGRQVVNARDLHTGLGVGRDFSNWIKDRIEKYGFCDGVDYETRSPNLASEAHGGQNRIDYLLDVSMAKELAMVENNEKGREVRQYLIKIEQAWNTPELVFARALQQANDLITRQSSRIAELAPKAEFFDQVTNSKDAIDMKEAAKVLNIRGFGRNNLFQFLRDEKIFMDNNTPYQTYIDRGYFRVIETKWVIPEGETRINLKTVVYQRGLDFIRKTINAKAAVSAVVA